MVPWDFSIRWTRFWRLFWCTTKPSCPEDDFLANHSMNCTFDDTWGVFRLAEHVFDDYFGVRRNPHTQEMISSQIIACSGHFRLLEGFRPTEGCKKSKFWIIFSDFFREIHSYSGLKVSMIAVNSASAFYFFNYSYDHKFNILFWVLALYDVFLDSFQKLVWDVLCW